MAEIENRGAGRLATWDSSILATIKSRTIDLFGYRFKVIVGDWVSKKIEEDGIYEAAQTRLIPSFIGAGTTCLDVGANIGYYTMWMSRLSLRGGSVHAFEPNPLTFSFLQENVQANGLENVFVNNVAVGQRTETTLINLDLPLPAEGPDGGVQNLGGWSLVRRRKGEHQVQVVSIDDYVAQKKIEKVSFIKIDVEGFEREVLAGARQTLEKMRPVIMIELAASNAASRDQVMKILDFLKIRKYNLAVVQARPFPHLRRLRPSDTEGDKFFFYAFAIRRDLDVLGA